MAGNALIEAAQSGDVERVKETLSRESARDTASLGAGQSPILEALYRGHRDVVGHLRAVWRLNLHEAAALGDVDRIRELLNAGSDDVNRHGYDGWTPLHLAAFMGRGEAAHVLLNAGADVSLLSGNTMANTALHAALAGAQSSEVVEILIRAGSDVNLRAGAGVTPLHLAASRGSEALVRTLLAAGADPAVAADDGKTAASFAAERGFPELAGRLESA